MLDTEGRGPQGGDINKGSVYDAQHTEALMENLMIQGRLEAELKVLKGRRARIETNKARFPDSTGIDGREIGQITERITKIDLELTDLRKITGTQLETPPN